MGPQEGSAHIEGEGGRIPQQLWWHHRHGVGCRYCRPHWKTHWCEELQKVRFTGSDFLGRSWEGST